jgi:negative regulator of sigma E activity
VLKNYTVTVGPAADIAGRSTTTLSLSSKYSNTLVARLWVDSATALVLQRVTYHADGTIDTKTGFDDVRIGGDFPKELFDLTVPPGMHVLPGATFAKAAKDVSGVQSSLNFAVISPTYLPDGFALEKAALSGGSADQGVQLVYSDGLRDFSVFENSSRKLPDLPNPQTQDVGDNSGVTAMLAGETVLSWNIDRLNVTMVGDLTARELAKIGESVKP